MSIVVYYAQHVFIVVFLQFVILPSKPLLMDDIRIVRQFVYKEFLLI